MMPPLIRCTRVRAFLLHRLRRHYLCDLIRGSWSSLLCLRIISHGKVKGNPLDSGLFFTGRVPFGKEEGISRLKPVKWIHLVPQVNQILEESILRHFTLCRETHRYQKHLNISVNRGELATVEEKFLLKTR